MPTSTVNYFHSASLRQRYIDGLEQALEDSRLRADEQQWLQTVVRPLVAEDQDPVRVDRLIFDNGSVKPFELAAALLLSHGHTDEPRVYLYTLAWGIEVFTDRRMLLTALRVRFANGHGNGLFEYEKIEGDPFRAQMRAIVDQQVEQVGQLTAQLKRTPSLLDASTASLARQLRDTLPHMPLDPQTHLLQIVPDSLDDADVFPITRTLVQAAFEDACKVKTEEGLKRRFLDAQGRFASDADTQLFTRALANAAATTGETYSELLGAFWEGAGSAQRTRRDQAIESLDSGVRRELYRCRHEGSLSATTLNALLPLLTWVSGELPADAALSCSRLAIKVGNSGPHVLAGTFVIQLGTQTDPSLLWFSPDHALLSFPDLAALTAYVATVQGRAQLRPTIALHDQLAVLAEGRLQLELTPIKTPLVADRVDSIIALQARNLAFVTGLSSAPESRTAMIDDALDIRQLLDPRQMQLNAGRWRRGAPFTFGDVWLTPPVDALMTMQSSVSARESRVDAGMGATLTPSWLEQTRAYDVRAERLRQPGSGLRDCAEQHVQQYVCVLLGNAVSVRDIHVQWLESTPADLSDIEAPGVPVSESHRAISMDLVSLLLECVSGRRPKVLPVGAQVLLTSSTTPASLAVELVNHMLDTLTANVVEEYVGTFEQSRNEFQRRGDLAVRLSTEALKLREGAMRLDLALGKRQRWIDSTAFSMVRQVLDRPVRSLRLALNVPVSEAFALSMTFGSHPAAPLSDTLVIRQLDPRSPVMFWSCVLGWQQCASIERVRALLQQELHGARRERWLQLLGERDRALLRTHLLKVPGNQVHIQLLRVDEHVAHALQRQALRRQLQDLQQLCLRAQRCRFDAGLFTRLATAGELDGPLIDTLDGLSVRIDNSLFEATLPSWLTSASLAELSLYRDLLQRYYLSSNGGNNFLFGIATMQDYVRERLVTQLDKDFPTQSLDPDRITVVSRRYVIASLAVGQVPSAIPAATVRHSESLNDYAINRFSNEQGSVLSIESVEQPQAVRLLTPFYVRQLVTQLDVGAGYIALLRKTLTPDDADYAVRKQLFFEQAPLMLLAVALPAKLQGRLSAQAFALISRVVDMPDGIAREPVNGVRAIISALQLVADQGMAADSVPGLYLICPSVPNAGPVVLCAIHHSPFTFREYASQAALMNDIRNDASLQQMILERLDPEIRRRYDHGGFTEPHLPFSVEGLGDVPLRAPGPVTLGLADIQGNALQCLFSDTIKLLLDTGVSNSVTNDQADRAGRNFLAMLGVGQVLSLLPGKLAALVTLWQSETLFRASAVSASGRHWGRALSEFSAALGVMVTAREQAIQEQAPEDQIAPGAGTADEDDLPSPFSWRNTSLSAEQRTRLQGLEARSVALNQMHHDDLLNLYLDKNDGTPYAVVAGKVYQVRHTAEEGKWIIVGADGTPGPQLNLDDHQH